MRKIVLTVLCFIFLCFLIPILFTSRMRVRDDANGNADIDERRVITDYSQFNTIRLLRHQTGEVEEMELEEYLLRCSGK